MTKQEKIRDGMAERCFENCDGATQEQCDELNKKYDAVDACRYCGADQVLAYLHSQGVVIKVKRELPEYWFDRGEGGYTEQHYIPSGLQECLEEAGYTAFESLLE